MKTKQILVFLLLSVVLQIAIAPLGGYGGHHIKFFAAAILYMILTLFMLKNADTSGFWVSTLLILTIPVILPVLIGITNDLLHGSSFKQGLLSTFVSWPSTLAQFAGIGFGFWINKVSYRYKIFLGLLWVGFSFWVMLSGYNLWLNKYNFGSYLGKVHEEAPSFIFTDSNNKTFSNQDFSKSTLVLEFWYTGCKYCFNDMPKFQKMFDQYGESGKVLFYSVNTPIREDSLGFAQSLLDKYHFNFPLLFASGDAIQDFKIIGYPTYLILERNTIIYRGSINGIENIVKDRLEK